MHSKPSVFCEPKQFYACTQLQFKHELREQKCAGFFGQLPKTGATIGIARLRVHYEQSRRKLNVRECPTGEASSSPEHRLKLPSFTPTTRHSQARGPLYRPRAASRAAPTAPCPSARLGDLSLEDLRLPFI